MEATSRRSSGSLKDHPLRPIRALGDAVLRELSPGLAVSTPRPAGRRGRPSDYLQVLYSIRSERQLMEQLDDDLLYRWFVGLDMDD